MTAPRRHIRLDALGGAAGDMFVAAMLDAFPHLQDRVFADLAAAAPDHAPRPKLVRGDSGGIAALRFGLETPDHHHHHDHDHGETRYSALRDRIRSADLHAGTADNACAILRILGIAESCIHGINLEQVHFHELADWDSLADVVAAGSLIAAVSPCTFSVSDLPLGGGTVRTQHGILPVPAPATLDILRGFAWRDDAVAGERVTPTGAAILAHVCKIPAPAAGGVLTASGIGAGTRSLPGMPNILRVSVFEDAAPAADNDQVAVIRFDVDDMTGEELGAALDVLRAEAGVLDVVLMQGQGKKGRPVFMIRVLARPAESDAVIQACFRETSTIGLRCGLESRVCLKREAAVAANGLRVKRVERPGGAGVKAESDDLSRFRGLTARRRAKAAAEQEETE